MRQQYARTQCTVHSIQPKWDENVLYDVCQDQYRFCENFIKLQVLLEFSPALCLRCLCTCVRTLQTYKRTHRCTRERSFDTIFVRNFEVLFIDESKAATTTARLNDKRPPILRDIIFKIIECHKFNQVQLWVQWKLAVRVSMA